MIVPLTPDHAPAAARLHIAGQPGTFLTALGPEVLTVLYAQLPQSAHGFGFAAVDDDGTVNGFVSATTSVGRLFAEMGTRRMGRFAPALLRRYAHAPGLVLQSAQTVLYPLLARADDSVDAHCGAPAELLSIMVEPALRGQGVGSALLARLVTECRAREVAVLDVTVDAAASGVSYQIFNPDSSFLLNQIGASMPYRGQLWQSGNHVIEVINRGGSPASYSVTFGVR